MKVTSWHESAVQRVDVAMGRVPADMVIRNGRWVNVYSGEIIGRSDIAIAAGRIAFVGENAGHTIGADTKIIEAEGRYMVPGLCDGHMHVESGMITVTEFARAVIPHGTTSMFIDPHEIANVLGLAGVKLMHDEAAKLPINVKVQIPSCVPSAPGLENAGAEITPQDVHEVLSWPQICGLGEVMNFPGVAKNEPKMVEQIAATQRAGKTVGGHFASPDLGRLFHGYVAGGPADDHEGTCKADAIARVRQGMRAMLRLGSAWYDVAEQVKAITEDGLCSRNFILCTDDCHAGTLASEGHMNRVVRHAIAQGLKPMMAIQMASLNTAQHFGLERECGAIAPGRRADLILTTDLVNLPIEMVIGGGQILAENGALVGDIPSMRYPETARNSVKLGKKLTPADFHIKAPEGVEEIHAHVIGVIENQAPTRRLIARLQADNGFVEMDIKRDICQIALIERHRATGGVVNGFVSGFGYHRPCAMASTVAHDSHHMIVVGTSREDMALAANHLGAIGGGVTIFSNGKELATIELPIAGLMSDKSAEHVAPKIANIMEAMKHCGCHLNNAYMQHSLLALVVIPELRISDIGLIDVTKFQKIDLFTDQPANI